MKRILTILLFLPFLLKAQIVINEFSAANMDNYPTSTGSPDWIELKNTSTSTVDLAGWALSDDPTDLNQYEFTTYNLAPGERIIVICDNLDAFIGGQFHTNFKITQTKPESVVLVAPNGGIADQFDIVDANRYDHSYARFPDGTGSLQICDTPSPGFENTSATFTAYTPTPTTTNAPGVYASAINVSLSAPTGYEIRYTLDGNEPTLTSTLYAGPIDIAETKVLRARTFPPTGSTEFAGKVLTNTYLIGVSHGIPIVSLSGGTAMTDLLDGGGWGGTPKGAIEIFGADGTLWCEGEGEANKHGNDSWAYAQRGFDWITRDESGITNELDYQLFPYRDRDEFQRIILKPAANDNYPFSNGGAHIRDAYVQILAQKAGMVLDARSYEPCVLYKNGQYWGVYEIREKVDDADYTSNYYGQGEKWIDYIKTWGSTWNEYGTSTDWYTLHNYITTQDLSIQANYDYVAERLEVLSLIDYFLINNMAVCTDWLNWNTSWWRGRKPSGDAKKWRYVLWDLDATFGHYINYTGVPSTEPDADPCQANDLSSDFEGHGAMIEALLQNEGFHNLYVNRIADLNNTFFSCDYMLPMLDSLLERIEPEMPDQIAKWGGTMSGWNANVQALKDFIAARCVAADQGIVDCYEVDGPYPLTVEISPATSPNKAQLNTILPANYPWSGDYFAPVGMNMIAIPATGWDFDHWETTLGSFSSNTAQTTTFTFDGTATVTAVFIPESPCGEIQQFALDSTNTAINMSWAPQAAAFYYEIGYRKFNVGEDWTTINLPSSNVVLGNLDPCTQYEIRLRSICTSVPTGNYLTLVARTKCPPVVNGSSDLSNDIAFSVWPNPSNGPLKVQIHQYKGFDDLSIQVYQPTGGMVWEQALDTKNVNVLPLEGLSDGLYLLRIIDRSGNSTTTTVLIRK